MHQEASGGLFLWLPFTLHHITTKKRGLSMGKDFEHCNGCTHWRHFCGRGENETYACHYILDVGKMRGCAVEDCNKNTKRSKHDE